MPFHAYIPFILVCFFIGAIGCIVVMIIEEQIRTAQSRGASLFWSSLFAAFTVASLVIVYAIFLDYLNLHFIDRLLGIPEFTSSTDINRLDISSRMSLFGRFMLSLLILLLTSAGKSFAWSMRSKSSRTPAGLVKRYRITDHLHYREFWLISFVLLIFKNVSIPTYAGGNPTLELSIQRIIAFLVMILLFFVGNEIDRWVPFGFRWQRALTIVANLLGIGLFTIVTII